MSAWGLFLKGIEVTLGGPTKLPRLDLEEQRPDPQKYCLFSLHAGSPSMAQSNSKQPENGEPLGKLHCTVNNNVLHFTAQYCSRISFFWEGGHMHKVSS